MRRKLIAAAATLVVMALIRPDANPVLWQAALVTMMFYGINSWMIEAICGEIRRYRRKRRQLFDKYNLKRWAEVDFVEHAHGRYIEISA